MVNKEYKQYTDAELWLRLQSGVEERDAAFTEIYHRYSSKVYLYARKILSDASGADDILHDAFLRMLEFAKNDKRPMVNLCGFLMRVARNLCLDHQKSRRRLTYTEDYEGVSEDVPYETNELAALITSALETIPPQHKEAVVMQMYGDLSYQEIAEEMKVPVTTIRNWICRAKAKIRLVLEPYFADELKR